MDPSFFSSLYSVKTESEFHNVLTEITDNLEDGSVVALHFETHGGEQGLQLTSGEIVSWTSLHEMLRPLNTAQMGLLTISFAACYTFPFLWSIDITERSSFRAALFTMRNMTVDEIERGFLSYYERYFNLLDVSKALTAIQEEVYDEDRNRSPFQLITAEWAFDQISNPDNNPNFKEIVMTQYAKMSITSPEITPYDVEQDIRKKLNFIRTHNRDIFLCKDMHDVALQ